MSMLLRRHYQENQGEEETPRPAPEKEPEVKEETPKKRGRKSKTEA